MNFNVDRINSRMNYQHLSLKSKPDIYLLFVESYGKLLYESPELRGPYFRWMDSCASVLLPKWHECSYRPKHISRFRRTIMG